MQVCCEFLSSSPLQQCAFSVRSFSEQAQPSPQFPPETQEVSLPLIYLRTDVGGASLEGQEREGQPSEGAEPSSSGRIMDPWALEPHRSSSLPSWLAKKPCLLWLKGCVGE